MLFTYSSGQILFGDDLHMTGIDAGRSHNDS